MQLRRQSQAYEKIIGEYEKKYNSTNHESEFRQGITEQEQLHLSNCKKRVEIASNINVKAFLKLDIEERKSDAHEVFKWIIVALYGEPDNKYYWPNFKVSLSRCSNKPSKLIRDRIWLKDWARSTPCMPRKSNESKLLNSFRSMRLFASHLNSRITFPKSNPFTRLLSSSTAPRRREGRSKN